MMSIASMISTNNSDIAIIEDFDEEETDGNFLFFFILELTVNYYSSIVP